jgi:Flp pilus assembly pilin Flp
MSRKKYRHLIAKLWRDPSGASSTEYAMLLAVIAAALLGAGSFWGGGLDKTFEAADNSLTGASASGHGGNASASDATTKVGTEQAGSGPISSSGASGNGTALNSDNVASSIVRGDQTSESEGDRLILNEG